MSPAKQTVLAFDAYGTLLSTESIAAQLATHFGKEKADFIAQEWRKYQLEYTWRLNSMDKTEPFSTVTQNSLHHALAESGVSLAPQQTETLMSAYNTLSLFPDAHPLLKSHLPSSPHHTVIFTNGTAAMLASTLQSSELAPHAHLFAEVITVEPTGKFKPHRSTYEHLLREVGKEGEAGDVWLVSSNPFDVVGANAVGLRSVWVDRGGKGWVDGLVGGKEGRPEVVVRGLDEVLGAIEGR